MNKKYFSSLLIATFTCAILQAQNLVSKGDIMSQLPRTAEDFQNYKFNYSLESGINILSDYSLSEGYFDGVGICIFEHNDTKIKNIKSSLYNIRGNGSFNELYHSEIEFSSSGRIKNYGSQIATEAKYWFGTDRWTQKEWVGLDIIPCVPNAYGYWTFPTRNEKGLIVAIDNELEYIYDSQERVREVRYHDGEFVYRYVYVGYSNKIQSISVHTPDLKLAEVFYTYTGDYITQMICNLYKTDDSARIEKRYEKNYTYNEKGDISNIVFYKYEYSLEKWKDKISYSFRNEYNPSEQLVYQYVEVVKSDNDFASHTRTHPLTSHTRKYSYDAKGNWIRIEQENQFGNKSVLNRIIEYWPNTFPASHIYEEEEVDIHANFGSNLSTALKKKGIGFEYGLEFITDAMIYCQVIVEEDGSILYYKLNSSKPRYDGALCSPVIEYLEKLKWAPAVRNGKFVRSLVTLSINWNNYSLRVVKDIPYGEKEKQTYEKNIKLIQFQKTEKSALSGGVDQKKALAKLYENGIGTDKNIEKALDLYLYCALEHDVESKNILYSYYKDLFNYPTLTIKLSRYFTPNNKDNNERWNTLCCESAAFHGNEYAISEIAERYLEGKGIVKDQNKAVEWLTKLADKGDTEAMIRIANIYLDESTEIFNESKGVEWFTKAAKLGNRTAINHLGYFYLNGIHVEKNKKLAKKILKGKMDVLQ